jgi:hypothetical protein
MPEISTQDIYYRLGQLEGKIDAFLTRLSAHEGDVGKLEERVQMLERAKHTASGYAAAVGAIAGVIVAFLTKVV